MWFGCCCVTIKDRFYVVSRLSKAKYYVPGRQNPKQNDKQGCAKIFAYPCESATSTLDGHNLLVRDPIRVFLDFTESSLSLEFNKINFLAKPWDKHWDGSRTVEEWFVLVSETSVFGTGLYRKCLGLHMA